jgi:integrase
MPKIKAKLTDVQIKNLKPKAKAFKQADEGGLNLLIRPSGTKVWQVPYQLADKYNVYTIGQYPDISAAEARKRRDEIKNLISQGIDPNLNKKAQRLTNQGQSDRTFEAIATEWFEQQVWVTKHRKNIQKKFAEDVFTKIGPYQIEKVKPADVVVVLKAIEARGSIDVAKRTCQHMSAIFEYAIVKGVCEYNPAMGRSKVIKSVPVKHRPHLREEQLHKFLNDLDHYRGGRLVQLAMKLLMLTMLRPGELRNGRWEEIDFKKKLWRIPSSRMKMRREHIVPLSRQALDILEEMKAISGKGELIFPGNRSPHRPISDVTLTKVLIILGYGGGVATAHGMRATASSILNEKGFNRDAIERQLAHVEGNKVRAAYHHTEYLEERQKMMQWYADFLEEERERKINA